ncbi:uncharacterized protein LOC127266510 [Andrographis paniculata]|uniref:uncharacterized protein LOC127266510 n=1 Tax=Andrographis paniculata TaxID=175694 RepID=UPI0021E997FB|nr:uncharacterized protein LOC127266510 [Andrographis paniculata]
MATEEEKSGDFYAVLGLEKECTAAELRNAYKKLAMKWHPDRCSSSGNSKEAAKTKFQAIQQAYSVLSDSNKRFLYDLGVYDSDDENDENGMGDFLNEMVTMMSQSKQNENKSTSFEELQQLFEDVFHNDVDAFNASPCAPTSSRQDSFTETHTYSNKRNSYHISSSIEATLSEGFCTGENIKLGRAPEERIKGNRRDGRKQKVSSGQDVSSGQYSGISA